MYIDSVYSHFIKQEMFSQPQKLGRIATADAAMLCADVGANGEVD